jgi:3-methyladenine DNA glycosylase/8-oxoguanine DNA glycosylase
MLEATPGLLGCHDEPEAFRPSHPVVERLHRQFAGLRICRTSAVVETLVPTILKQKVTSLEAARSYRALLVVMGGPAPGPADLLLPPSAQRLSALPYWRFHPLGIERKRAEIIRRVCAQRRRLESLTRVPSIQGQERLQAIPGVGRWSASEVARVAWGDADAVRLGDYHLPGLVSWALAGERRADDSRMLELLEPYRGHRGRAVRLLQLGGLYPPRRAPRMPPRSIEAI